MILCPEILILSCLQSATSKRQRQENTCQWGIEASSLKDKLLRARCLNYSLHD